ncbi:hypothetical protein [Sphingobium sp.]|uniref:hypothetical protein n=1 Tax=Sphingobium sp. TaxID=1912891 RepID=UPI003B3AF5B1
MDDLNYLLKREQEELLRAQTAPGFAARRAHQHLALKYAERIRDHRAPYRSEAIGFATSFDPLPLRAKDAAL